MKSERVDIAALEDALEHRFQRRALLEQALTHASFAREVEQVSAESAVTGGDNEQLEFLGDAVLSFVVSQELFRRFPDYQEGELSKLRAYVVSARHLVKPARALEIGKYLRFGKGEERSGGRSKSALLVNALEALIAALYLDAGLEAAHDFIVRCILEPELMGMQQQGQHRIPVTDYKSALQEAAHVAGRPQPRYVLVKEEGPEHRKTFIIDVHLAASAAGEEAFASRGEGSTKKRAEQRAARQAWEHLQSLQRSSVAEEKQPAADLPKQL